MSQVKNRKRFLSVLILFLMPLFLSRASAWNTLAGGNVTIARIQVASALTTLCVQWIPENFKKTDCLGITNEFMRAIDLGTVKIETPVGEAVAYPVVFRHKLLEKLQDPRVTFFLQTIIEDYSFAQVTKKGIWDIHKSIKKIFPAPVEQVEILSTLFQDTSSVASHLLWLQYVDQTQQLTDLQRQNVSLLKEVFSRLDENADSIQKILVDLPSYHQYIPQLIALRLKEEGFTGEKIFIYAYGMNYLYEYLQAAMKNNSVIVEPSSWTKSIAEKIDLRDVYRGYIGVFRALRLESHIMSLKEFSVLFKEDQETFHRTLLDLLQGCSRILDF